MCLLLVSFEIWDMDLVRNGFDGKVDILWLFNLCYYPCADLT